MDKYREWPLGIPPKELQRKELDEVRELGYDWKDARDVITMFEEKVAKFAGSKYACAVDSCTNGIFLSLKHHKHFYGHEKGFPNTITIPSRTWVSVPMAIKHAGFDVEFSDEKWKGVYDLEPFNITDGAGRWTQNMYSGIRNSLHIISFQIKKRIHIGKGGMILTNNQKSYEWLKLASNSGRHLEKSYREDNFGMIGWNMYMTPEDAARGIIIMDKTPTINEDSHGYEQYTELSEQGVFLD